MATTTGTAADEAWIVVSAGTFTLNGLGGVDTLFLGTSLTKDYTVSSWTDGIHVDSVSGASAALHATLQNMEVLVYNSGHDYQGIGNMNVAFFDGSKSSLNANTSRPTSNFSIYPTSTGYSAHLLNRTNDISCFKAFKAQSTCLRDRRLSKVAMT
jgi:hypothetical protein